VNAPRANCLIKKPPWGEIQIAKKVRPAYQECREFDGSPHYGAIQKAYARCARTDASRDCEKVPGLRIGLSERIGQPFVR
jgi:hypothetical protein